MLYLVDENGRVLNRAYSASEAERQRLERLAERWLATVFAGRSLRIVDAAGREASTAAVVGR